MTKPSSVLVVDDEPDNFDVIEALLSSQNYQLNYVKSGTDAIAYLDSFQPDLILLDVMMPGMDGIEVCKRIKSRSQWSAVPIMMVTALHSKATLAQCLATGADDFISKPINALELRARVQSMLRIKQQYDSIQSLYHIQKSTIHILESTLETLNGTLVSTLAHELNTPLNGILGTINFLNSRIDTLPMSDIKEMLGWVDESAQRLGRLTQKFRIYLELQLAIQNPSPPHLEPSQFAQASIRADAIACAEKCGRCDDLSFQLENAEVRLSEKYVSIVVQELTENALKFSDPGTPIHLTSKVVDGMLKFSVHDRGRGMTDEQIAQIDTFVQFERATYEQQGVGLGLKIVQKIAELAGGVFSIQSTYQQETTSELSLLMVCNDTSL